MKRQNLINIICRLENLSVQLHNVTAMVNNGQPSPQILHQIEEIQRELHLIRYLLVLYQVRESISVIQDNPDPKFQVFELARIQDLYKERI
jgi:DNA-binding FrmR family transcriptional regulator